MPEPHSSFSDLFKEGGKQVKKRSIRVNPDTSRYVWLGVYLNADPEPDFEVTFEPDQSDFMGISFTRLDIPNEPKYSLMYQFYNYGTKPCLVTLRRVATTPSQE